MKNRIRPLFLVLSVFLALASPGLHAAQKPVTDISISGNAVTVTADAGDVYLRIGGPNDYFREIRGRGFVEWTPDAGATDGVYSYDCYVSAGVPRDGSISEDEMEAALEAASTSSHGSFNIEGGIVTEKGEDEPPASLDDDNVPQVQGMQPSKESNLLWNAIGGLLNALVPPAHALDTVNDDMQVNGYIDVRGNLYDGAGTLILNDSARVTGTLDVRGNFFDGAGVLTLNDDVQVNGYINATGANGGYFNYSDSTNNLSISGGDFYIFSETPQIYFYDQTTTDYNWYFDANDDSFKLRDTVDANNNIVFQVDALGGSTNLANSILINTLGDIQLADSAVFIDRSADEVGIGTLSPAGSLHILDDALPELILEDSGAGSTRWELEASPAEIHVYGYNSTTFLSTYPFRINNGGKSNSLVIGNLASSTGNIGMGTNDPETGLHMLKYDGTGIIKVQEQNAVTEKRIQVQLENNGPTGFKFVDTSVVDRAWTVSMLPGGGFTFSFVGTGGGEFQITPGGRVTMGPGPAINFDLSQTGDLDIPNGEVSAVAFNTISSRSAKRNFEPLDSKAVMQKLSALDISEWEYRNPNVKGRHIGPVAEEFHALFGLGDSNKQITPSDMAGIGLLAAKSLQAETDRLKAENAELKARLGRLEAMVERLSAER